MDQGPIRRKRSRKSEMPINCETMVPRRRGAPIKYQTKEDVGFFWRFVGILLVLVNLYSLRLTRQNSEYNCKIFRTSNRNKISTPCSFNLVRMTVRRFLPVQLTIRCQIRIVKNNTVGENFNGNSLTKLIFSKRPLNTVDWTAHVAQSGQSWFVSSTASSSRF